MQRHLYLDIETIPAQRSDVLAEIRASKQAALDAAIAAIKAPGNYGEEAAAKFMATKGAEQAKGLRDAFESDVDDEYRRTGLDGSFGQIAVVSYAVNDGPAAAIYNQDPMSLESERATLRGLLSCLTAGVPVNEMMSTCVVGHNVSSFDLRFLAQRSIVQGIRPHPVIARAARAKPWEQEIVFDTMTQWSGVGGKVKLNKLCKALGLPGKSDFDGSMVWDAIRAGQIERVADYCNSDVELVRQIHRRMTFAAPALTSELEDIPA